MTVEIRVIELANLEALAIGMAEFERATGLSAEVGGVLPPEFIANFLPYFRERPEWLGVWAVSEARVVGSGLFKSALVDGKVEIGYGVATSFEGRGVATQIAKAMIQYAFARGARKVFANTLPDSKASQSVLKKAGMKFVGVYTDPDGGLVNRYLIER